MRKETKIRGLILTAISAEMLTLTVLGCKVLPKDDQSSRFNSTHQQDSPFREPSELQVPTDAVLPNRDDIASRLRGEILVRK